MDGRSGLQPALWSSLPRQARRIEQNGPRDDAILQGIDTPFRAATRGLDLFHRHAVISLAFHHDVTVHGVKMAVTHPMVRARVLVSVRGASRIDVAENALEDVGRIRSLFLHDIVGQRYAHALFSQRHRLLPFGRRDKVGGAEFVVFSPSAPVRKFLHRPAEILLRCNRLASIARTLCIVDGNTGHKHDSDQTTHQDFHRKPPS